MMYITPNVLYCEIKANILNLKSDVFDIGKSDLKRYLQGSSSVGH